MTTTQSLSQSQMMELAICEYPDDDELRRKYANHIVSFDPIYGEFIGLQLDRAANERGQYAATSTVDLGGREFALEREHAPDWARYLQMFLVPETNNPLDLGCTFERGFIAHARVAVENVVGLGARLYRLAPIQHLDIAAGDGPPVRVLAVDGLERLHSISFAGLGLGDDDADAIAGCAALARATWIDLSNNNLHRRGVEALARSPLMANKVRLLLKGNPYDPTESPWFDYDGSVANRSDGRLRKEIEDAVGSQVLWLHYPWANQRKEPDRYHARWFAPLAGFQPPSSTNAPS